MYGRLPAIRIAAAGHQGGEICFKNILLYERHIGGQLRREQRHHLTIHLHRREVRHPRRQPERQRSGPRSDLDETIVRKRRYRLDDLVGPGPLEEVLTVSFLGAHSAFTFIVHRSVRS